MLRINNIKRKVIKEENSLTYDDFLNYVKNYLKKNFIVKDLKELKILKVSIDSRHQTLSYVISACFSCSNEEFLLRNKIFSLYNKEEPSFKLANKKLKAVVVGMGPSGLFAAKTLSEAGLDVTIVDRGEKVEDRVKTIEGFFNGNKLNPESNIQYGEGGAGTFSDGKLTTGTQSIYNNYVTNMFVKYGADFDITYQAYPHIGTDVLRNVIINMRKDLQEKGVKFLFNTKLVDFNSDSASFISLGQELTLPYDKLVLATGHSATDIYELLKTKNIEMTPKNLSVGVRIEHPRNYINKLIYHDNYPNLPQAVYKLSTHLNNGRGVYTFCMCPGGEVVNASSQDNRLCINGMSYKGRDLDNSNSAILVGINTDDYYFDSVLDGVKYLDQIETKAYLIGKGKPICQKLDDFYQNQITASFGKVLPSIKPLYTLQNLNDCLPDYVVNSLKEGINDFDKKLPGFKYDDAVLTGVETRTSSPITVIRDEMGKTNYPNLYCIGEGFGHSGGIMSSSVDGIKIAVKIIEDINEQ